ncbi:MAG: hypothetical protein ACRCYS_18225 [Beijerinckiaceae bacterium]
MTPDLRTAILAANADVRAYWDARPSPEWEYDRSRPIGPQMDAANAAVKAHRATFPREETEAIWRKHGFVPCEDATGMRYAG